MQKCLATRRDRSFLGFSTKFLQIYTWENYKNLRIFYFCIIFFISVWFLIIKKLLYHIFFIIFFFFISIWFFHSIKLLYHVRICHRNFEYFVLSFYYNNLKLSKSIQCFINV